MKFNVCSLFDRDFFSIDQIQSILKHATKFFLNIHIDIGSTVCHTQNPRVKVSGERERGKLVKDEETDEYKN